MESLWQRKPSDSRQYLDVHVQFGTPSKFCKGTGICQIFSAVPKVIKCQFYRAKLARAGDTLLVFKFSSNTIPNICKKVQFNESFFHVMEPYSLSQGLCEKLGFVHRMKIRAGSYFVEEKGNEITIELRVNEMRHYSSVPDTNSNIQLRNSI